MKNLENKVAIISGSSQGIGKAIAKLLLEKGASVVINGRNPERLEAAEQELLAGGGKVLSVVADLTNSEEAKAVIDQCIERFGRLDFLINNAGVSMRGDFAALKPEVFDMVFRTNVIGVSNLSIPAMPYLRESKGSLVFISSVAGIRGLPGLSAYSSSKMALKAIAESIRIEEAGTGLHVGLINVGFTEIEFKKQTIGADGNLITIKDRSKFKVQTKETVAKAVLTNILKRRFVSTLTPIGKLNKIMQTLLPGLVEKILINSVEKIKERG